MRLPTTQPMPLGFKFVVVVVVVVAAVVVVVVVKKILSGGKGRREWEEREGEGWG